MARPRRSALRVNICLVLGVLLAAAAVLAAPREPEVSGGTLRVSSSGALRIESSRGHRPVLTVPNLAPGRPARGQVTIRNRGAEGRLGLSVERLIAGPGGDLTRHLRLRVQELTPGARALLYAGPLAAMPPLRLGRLPAGASRRFRFVAILPTSKGNLMGAGVRFDLRWRLRD